MHAPLPVTARSHTSIRVADAERSLEFYRRVPGFEARNDLQMSGASVEKALGIATGISSRAIFGSIAGQRRRAA